MTYLGRKNDVEATFQMAKLPAKTLIVVIVAMVGLWPLKMRPTLFIPLKTCKFFYLKF